MPFNLFFGILVTVHGFQLTEIRKKKEWLIVDNWQPTTEEGLKAYL